MRVSGDKVRRGIEAPPDVLVLREELQPFVEEGLLVRDASRLYLRRRGMLLANEIMAVFV